MGDEQRVDYLDRIDIQGFVPAIRGSRKCQKYPAKIADDPAGITINPATLALTIAVRGGRTGLRGRPGG